MKYELKFVHQEKNEMISFHFRIVPFWWDPITYASTNNMVHSFGLKKTYLLLSLVRGYSSSMVTDLSSMK